MKTITEYTLIFKENTELFNEYDGEYITENKEETDFIFENKREQIDEYYSKDWIYVNDDWQEDKVEIFYHAIKTYELCPYCGEETQITEFGGKCKNCGRFLKPCSLCDMENVNCEKCKFDMKGNI